MDRCIPMRQVQLHYRHGNVHTAALGSWWDLQGAIVIQPHGFYRVYLKA